MLILPICLFPLNCSAFGVENLINSDLSEWISDNPDFTRISSSTINGDTVYCIFTDSEKISDSTTYLRYSLIYDVPELKVGNSYTFNLHLLSAEEVGSANVYGETALYTGFKNGNAVMFIGLGSYDPANDWVTGVENAHIVIDKDNYLSYYGSDISIQFELPNIVNPCIFIGYLDASTSPIDNWAYFKDLQLIDNTKAEEDNFFTRLFEWFENKFKQLFNVLLYLDPDGEQDYNNPFAPNDTDVNGADNLEHLQTAINKFVESVEDLTLYLRVPSEMLTVLGNKFPIIPIIVVFTLVGLVVMRLFGVRRDS